MRIIIEGKDFDFEEGSRILKTKYGDTPFPGLEPYWDSIEPLDIHETMSRLESIYDRKWMMEYIGMEWVIRNLEPVLLDTETFTRTSTHVEDDGEVVERTFTETVELYRVDSRFLFFRPEIDQRNRETGDRENVYPGYKVEEEDLYFVKRRDESTGEEVREWIDLKSLMDSFKDRRFQLWRITAAEAAGSLFWTKLWWDEVETVARIGKVTCFKAKPDVRILIDMVTRPLTGQEYREILRSET